MHPLSYFLHRIVVLLGENWKECTWCSARYEVSAPKTLAAVKDGSIQTYFQRLNPIAGREGKQKQISMSDHREAARGAQESWFYKKPANAELPGINTERQRPGWREDFSG